MTDQPFDPEGGPPPTEEELRAAYEAELKRLRVEDVILQTVISLLNLGARRAGLVEGGEDEYDLNQAGLAIEGARALLPIVEPALGESGGQLRDALAQLQMAYAQQAGVVPGAPGPGAPAPPGAAPDPAPGAPGEEEQGEGAGPAQRSGRLWVPGQ